MVDGGDRRESRSRGTEHETRNTKRGARSNQLPLCLILVSALLGLGSSLQAQPTNSTGPPVSSLLEAAGHVEYSTGGTTNWRPATAGLTLRPGDRVRTLDQSRAAVQLSDRSVIRLNARTTLELLPPRRAEKRRFGLPAGSLFFFNREKPSDIEFDTPLAAGAIRGTEFMLEVAESQSAMRLALIDGRVALQSSTGELALERGQELRLESGRPPVTTALVNVVSPIQWALYYPAVLVPEELGLSTDEQAVLHDVLHNYKAGDLLAALSSWPANFDARTDAARTFRVALDLAVGRVPAAEQTLGASFYPPAVALRELIDTVQGHRVPATPPGQSASRFLARTYTLQAQADLPGALAAARHAVALAPDFGPARARLAELLFSFGNYHAAAAELQRALAASPRLAPVHALQGFIRLEQGDTRAALEAFDRARDLDAAFGPAWLGRGLCLLRDRQFNEARSAFQAAAALEPQRSLFRAYLGKTASELGEPKMAEKEFGLAKRLDPKDPTGWFYSALHLWQQNRINEAIRDLEESTDLNDQRALFRSRLLLDNDRSVRSADLAAIYSDAGLNDVSRHTAARSVSEDYANFSGHLFLADSYQSQQEANRFDLRLETARQSELLVANLLAPPGAGNLSQVLSQQEHLQFFDPRPIAVSSLTEYTSRGDWHQAGTVFGTVDKLSYAFDADYQTINGNRPNNDSDTKQFALTLKQGVTPDDELYFQAGYFHSQAGDVANRYDPASAVLGFRVEETQEPTLYAGWHHRWSPGSHTLFLFSRLDDKLSYTNPEPNVIFFQQPGGVITDIQTAGFFPPFRLDFSSHFTLYSGELQQIWETERESLVVGGRWQSGQVNTHSVLGQDIPFPGLQVFSTNQDIGTDLDRGNVYAYGSAQVLEPLRLIAGVSYDHLSFPENTDFPPISPRQSSKDQVSPKAGFLFTPWARGLFRGYYTRSLGGLFFDNSIRLEPTQIAGFNQAYRSLIPESVEGLLPGATFETAGLAFDQSFKHGTWFGVEAEWLTSDGTRAVGTLTNGLPFPIHNFDVASSTQQRLDFRERDLSAYAAQLLGDFFSVSVRYRLSEGTLHGTFPGILAGAPGLDSLNQDNRAVLHQVALATTFNHPTGFFAQWESVWYNQHNSGYTPALPDSDFWQHNIFAGYRFPRRYAELRLGVLNLADTDYRLNPLNLHPDLFRSRTFIASLRLNF